MKWRVMIVTAALVFAGCVSKNQMAETLKNNPEILADAIKKNPSVFMDALREAAQNDQQNQMEKAMQERQAQREKDFKNPRNIKIDVNRIVYGNANAPITIVKYADFQCPACRMGFQSLEEVKKKYPGKIRFIHKNIPLTNIHPMAEEAAEIYEALVITDKTKALAFYKAAYGSQGQWNDSAKLWAMVKKLGVNKDKVQAEIKKGVVAQRIQEDLAEHEHLGFQGTPGYVINGVAMYGAQSPEEFSAVIDRALKSQN